MRWPLFALLGLAAASAGAQTAPGSPTGRLLASNCFQCHGTNGKGPGFDRLAGKPAQEIYEEMKAFQSGKEGNGIMAKHSMGYTDAQLRQLSQWLSGERRAAPSSPDPLGGRAGPSPALGALSSQR